MTTVTLWQHCSTVSSSRVCTTLCYYKIKPAALVCFSLICHSSLFNRQWCTQHSRCGLYSRVKCSSTGSIMTRGRSVTKTIATPVLRFRLSSVFKLSLLSILLLGWWRLWWLLSWPLHALTTSCHHLPTSAIIHTMDHSCQRNNHKQKAKVIWQRLH